MKRVLYCKSTMDMGRRLVVVSSKTVVVGGGAGVRVGAVAEVLAITTVPTKHRRCSSSGGGDGVMALRLLLVLVVLMIGAATARRREHGVATRHHRVALTVPHHPHVPRQTPGPPPQRPRGGRRRSRATTIGPRRRGQRVRGRALPVEHSFIWRRFEQLGVGRVAARVEQAKLAGRVALLPVRGHGDVGRQSNLGVGRGLRRGQVRVGVRGVPRLVGAMVAGEQGHGLLVAVLRGARAGGQTLQQSQAETFG